MVIDSTTATNKGYIAAIQAQIENSDNLTSFNAFLQQNPVVDFTNPQVAAAAQACCSSSGNGPCCTFPITVQPKF